MLYHLYDLQHAALTPMRLQAELAQSLFRNPFNPFTYTPTGRMVSAAAEMIERSARRFGKPEFGLHETFINGKEVHVMEEVVLEKPFCRLLNFKRDIKRNDPKVLIAAPMSGHYATLLRGTVKALLPHHNVFITDWEDTRQVPKKAGRFNLDDYITYLREFISLLGPDVHVIAVCQPAVPVLAAVSLMASDNDPCQPATMTLMGGPIDTRVSKTEVTDVAETRDISWFEQMAVHEVPFYYPGAFRKVYPGFLQLGGFMSMNMDRHVGSYMTFFKHLVQGDGGSAEKHRTFYDEYLSVMDIPAEFYLQTVETVFQTHALPRGIMQYEDPLSGKFKTVRPQDIKHTAMLTIEGELDDISARGQTTAAHEMCYSLPQKKQFHHFQLECGHYGIFNGTKWRNEIMPRIRNFIRAHDEGKDKIPAKDLEKIPDIAPERYNRDKHGIAAIRRWLETERPQSYKIAHPSYEKVQSKDKKQRPTAPSKIYAEAMYGEGLTKGEII